MRTTGCLVLAAALSISPVVAQSTSPLFEVASVRVNTIGGVGKSGEPTPVGTGGVMTPQGNQFTARNATLRTLVRFAYGSDGDLSTPALLAEYRVAGGPSWIGTEAFDIVARMPERPRTPGEPALMLRALLARRFALKVHTETRELPAYALVRASRDGSPGPQLRVASGACVPQTGGVARGQALCAVRQAFQGLIATGASMTQLAAALYPHLGLMVLNRTTLQGTFDFDLRFTDGLTADARFPSLFTAVQEQLGLKLEPIHAPVEVVVIDSVQRPTGN